MITLLYRSFKSEVANLPPSNGTKGLNSGGITGIVVKIIHSGLFPVSINDSISFNLFIDLSSDTFDLVSFIVLIKLFFSSSRLIDFKISSDFFLVLSPATVKEIKAGLEGGVAFKDFLDFKEKDIIEVFSVVQSARTIN